MISRRPSQACIITFMGPVGVGKSTHIQLLRDHLRSKKIRVVTTFIKSSHGLSYVLNRLLIAPNIHEVSYRGRVTRVYSSKKIIKKLFPLYCLLDAISIAAKFFFTVYLPLRLGFTILIEEGLIMTLYTYNVSFPRFFGTEQETLPLLPRLLAYIKSKDHVNIVLDANSEELDRRRKNRHYRQNELAEYIDMQKEWLSQSDFGRTVLIGTTNESIARVHKNVLTTLKEYKCL